MSGGPLGPEMSRCDVRFTGAISDATAAGIIPANIG